MTAFVLPKIAHPDFALPRRKPVGPVTANLDHPWLRGCKALFIDNEGPPIEQVSGTKMIQLSAPARITTRHGRGWTATSSADGFYTAHTIPANTGDYTFFCCFHYDIGGNFSYFCALDNGWGLAINNGTNKPYFRDGVNLVGADNSLVSGRQHTVVGTVVGSTKYLYIDGVEASTDTKGNDITAQEFCLLMFNVTGSFSANDGRALFNAGYIDRAWSPGEVKAYADRPFDFEEPASSISYFPSVAAVGGGRIMGSIAGQGGLAGMGGLAGRAGGLAG